MRDDADRAAVRHGVSRIDAEVEQNQLEFRRIDQNGPKVVREVSAHMDVAPQGAIEQIAHRVELGAKIDRLGLKRLTPGES